MAKKIYVGNMSYNTTKEQIQDLFSQHGTVLSVAIITDRDTGRPKGFGFVEMDGDEAAAAAIAALDGKEVDGRALKVNEAKPKTDDRRPSHGGGGGRRY
ncbi:MAG: RNA-binding protein [Spirochaetes bacterium]|nr:RNA-binding protein [Spirochaetota bacterium]